VARERYSPTEGEVLTPTEARQASPRTMNFRVLVVSTALITLIFAAFVAVFFLQTPPSMDGSEASGVQNRPVTTIPQNGHSDAAAPAEAPQPQNQTP